MDYVENAKKVAVDIGVIVKRKMNEKLNIEEKKSPFDIVTDIDKMAEKYIRETLLNIYPEHDFLGEEDSFENPLGHKMKMENLEEFPYLWIVDPIDGTNNFVQGIQGFSISIALLHFGELIVGVIYDPIRDELFWAGKDKGAYLNENRIKVSTKKELTKCVVGASIASDSARRKKELQSIESVAENCLSLRVLGSACTNLAYVATGRLDAFWHYNLNVWDVAAGVLIIREAGGMISDISGSDYTLQSNSILVSNNLIHDNTASKLTI